MTPLGTPSPESLIVRDESRDLIMTPSLNSLSGEVRKYNFSLSVLLSQSFVMVCSSWKRGESIRSREEDLGLGEWT